MKGSVVRKGKRWYVIIEDQDRDTGERKRRWHSGFATKREAEAERVILLAARQSGRYVTPSQLTVGTFLRNEWLPAIRSSVRPNTHETYCTQVNGYIGPGIGGVLLQQLSPSDLRAFYGSLLTSGRRDGRGLAAKTVRNVAIMLRSALRDAVDWGLIARNPADRVDLPRRQTRQMLTWTPDELRRFLEHVQRDPMSPLALLIATTGMRRSEALGLHWRAVDFDAGRLEVTQSLVMVNGKPTITSETKTGQSRRSIALDNRTVDVLRAHRKEQLERRMEAGSLWVDHDLVFTQANGRPLSPPQFTRWMQKQALRASVPPIGIQGIRHTWATLALQHGVHPKIVQERLGHSSIKVTMDTYSHSVPEMHEAAARQVADLAFGRSSVEAP